MLNQKHKRHLRVLIKKEVQDKSMWAMTEEVMWDIRKHTVWLVQEHFVPLTADYDMTVEGWLPKTSYTKAEQDEMLDYHRENPTLHSDEKPERTEEVKAHCKAECYPEPKYPRPIKSRSMAWKIFMGPAFHAIGEQLFKTKFFIKKIPIDQRPVYLKENVTKNGTHVDSTDYSSFEAHFIALIMFCVEFVLYEWILIHHPIRVNFMKKV